MKLTLNLASLHLLNSVCPCDIVFYVLRVLPLIADKLYYEAPLIALKSNILCVKTDSRWKVNLNLNIASHTTLMRDDN